MYANGGNVMAKVIAKCPNCGTTVKKPRTEWDLRGRPSKKGERVVLHIGLFDCPKCKKTFRKVMYKRKEKVKR